MQTQFDELHCIASKVPGSDVSLYNYNSQLVLKYDGLKNIARVGVSHCVLFLLILFVFSVKSTVEFRDIM